MGKTSKRRAGGLALVQARQSRLAAARQRQGAAKVRQKGISNADTFREQPGWQREPRRR